MQAFTSRIASRVGANSTPARIRLLSLAVIAALALTWVADAVVVNHRRQAVSTFASGSEPLLVTAQGFQSALDQADASAANAFLAGGIEPAAQRAAYLHSIQVATTALTTASAQLGSAGVTNAPVLAIARNIGVYTGLVEQARALNRQGFPVGAAYLRDASQLVRSTLLPAAATLTKANATRLNDGERNATSGTDVAVAVLALVLLLGTLLALQRLLAIRTRRALNVGLAAATVVSLVLAVIVLGEMSSERSSVVTANDHGYAPVAELSRAKALAFQAQADESQALIAQGSGQSYLADFSAASAQVTALLGQARAATSGAAQASASAAANDFTSYLGAAAAVAACDASGQHVTAVALALGALPAAQCGSVAVPPTVGNDAFARFVTDVQDALTTDQAAFVSKAGHASSGLGNLPVIIAASVVIAAALALAGAQVRMNEYR